MGKRYDKRTRAAIAAKRQAKASKVLANTGKLDVLARDAALAPIHKIRRKGHDVTPYTPDPVNLTKYGRGRVMYNIQGSEAKRSTHKSKDVPVFDVTNTAKAIAGNGLK